MIAGVLGIHANNEFSRATFPFFFFFLFFFFSQVVSSEKNNLSNHFYSTLEEEERGKGGETLFVILIALQHLGEALLSLSKLTQPGPELLERLGSADALDRVSTI